MSNIHCTQRIQRKEKMVPLVNLLSFDIRSKAASGFFPSHLSHESDEHCMLFYSLTALGTRQTNQKWLEGITVWLTMLLMLTHAMLPKPNQSQSSLCLSSISGKIYSPKAHPVFSLLPHFIKLTHHSYFLSIIWLWLSSRITTTRRGAMVVFHGFPSVSLIHFSELPQAAMIS